MATAAKSGKVETLIQNLQNVPQELKDKPQWVVWRFEERDGKPTKVLYSNGRRAKTNKPSTWMAFDLAVEQYRQGSAKYDGVGFVFTRPLFGIDLDSCIFADGSLTAWSQEVLRYCPSYCEVSPSGAGLKIIGIGELPMPLTKADGEELCGRNYRSKTLKAAREDKTAEILIYRRKFFTITGQVFGEYRSLTECPGVVDLFNELFAKKQTPKTDSKPQSELTSHVTAAVQAMLKIPIPPNENDGSSRLLKYARQAKRFLTDESDALRAIQNVLQLHPTPKNWTDDAIRQRYHQADVTAGEGMREKVIDDFEELGKNMDKRQAASKFADKTSQNQGKKGVSSQNSKDKTSGPVIPELFEYQPFPVDELPGPLAEFVKQVALAVPCDPSFAAMPLLAGLAACIGNSLNLRIKRGWNVPPILWLAVVALSGSVKSAPARQALRAIHSRQARLVKQFDQDFAEWERQNEVYQKELAAFRKSRDLSEEPPEAPIEPVCPRIVVNDTTVEALGKRLKDNPRGLLAAYDELAGWLAGFNRYSKGTGDEARWLEFYNAQTSIIDRASANRPMIIDRASVSLCGTIQPGILRKHLTAEYKSSGLAARLLFTMPPRMRKSWSEHEIDESTENAVAEIFDKLLAIEMQQDEDGELRPALVSMHHLAKQLFVSYFNRHNKEQQELAEDLYAAYAKLEEVAARLALIIHAVRYCIGEVKELYILDCDSMFAGIQLCEWFKSEARRVYSVLAENELAHENRQLLQWITSQEKAVTPRDVFRGNRHRFKTVDEAEQLLQSFVQAELGEWQTSEPTEVGGRPTRRFKLMDSGQNPKNSRD
jgi:hypothetical protein